MAVFAEDFTDPTPQPDLEQIKVPTTAKPDQSPAPGPVAPSTGSPADALHPERTAAIAAGKDPDKATPAPKTDPGSPGLVVNDAGELVENPSKTKQSNKK